MNYLVRFDCLLKAAHAHKMVAALFQFNNLRRLNLRNHNTIWPEVPLSLLMLLSDLGNASQLEEISVVYVLPGLPSSPCGHNDFKRIDLSLTEAFPKLRSFVLDISARYNASPFLSHYVYFEDDWSSTQSTDYFSDHPPDTIWTEYEEGVEDSPPQDLYESIRQLLNRHVPRHTEVKMPEDYLLTSKGAVTAEGKVAKVSQWCEKVGRCASYGLQRYIESQIPHLRESRSYMFELAVNVEIYSEL